jgi:Tfp pilus assembly protein PilN
MSQQINLLNPLFLSQQKYFSAVAMLQALGLLLIGLVIASVYLTIERGRLAKEVQETARLHKVQEARFKTLSFELSPDRMQQELEAGLKAVEQQIAAHRTLLSQLDAGVSGPSAGYASLLQALSRQAMEGLWLTAIRVEAGSQEISLRGRARSEELIPPYLSRLGRESLLKGKSFEKLELSRKSEGEVPARFVEFSFTTVGSATAAGQGSVPAAATTEQAVQ